MENEDVVNAQDLVEQAQPEAQPTPETVQQETKPVEQPEQGQEGIPQKSFRMLREEKERIEKERDEMRRRLSELRP